MAPRELQDDPKRAPRCPEEGTKMAPRRLHVASYRDLLLQDPPRRLKRGPKKAPGPANWPQEAPKRPSRGSREVSRTPSRSTRRRDLGERGISRQTNMELYQHLIRSASRAPTAHHFPFSPPSPSKKKNGAGGRARSASEYIYIYIYAYMYMFI